MIVQPTIPGAQPLTRAEQDDFNGALEQLGSQDVYSVEPEVGQSNWGTFPLVQVQNRATGRSHRYYRNPPGHPRYWVNQFSEAMR